MWRFDILRLAVMAGLAGRAGWAAMSRGPGYETSQEPYIADGMLRVLLIDASGKTTEERSFPIVAARGRSGSLYRSQERPQGKLVNLWMKSTGFLYLIDHAQKSVETLGHMEVPPSDQSVRASSTVSAEQARKVVAGLTCTPEPVFTVRDGKRVQSGEKCYAADPAGLLLSSSTELALQGKTIREEMEITSIRRGAELEVDWFAIPEGFQAIKRRGR
ncbi:MAG: hypothetical protein HXY18_10430 [Bryobacteraceae bacterium]|nr:hypothetical protein [Bryobacteraceae bacterium]